MKSRTLIAVVAAALVAPSIPRVTAATIPVVEDVMTSSFFTGTDLVRGYPGEGRPTLRVSTDDAFGLAGAETVYLTFAASDLASYGGPVPSALLSVLSVAGGFNADADADAPFQISAHAVTADPLTSITDDTNPGGSIAWNAFLANNVLPASAAATTTVTGFGTIQFDVTAIVNDWISGANAAFAIALTGKNHAINDAEFLHGIRNNNDAGALGSTFITVVPEPGAAAMAMLATASLLGVRRRPGC